MSSDHSRGFRARALAQTHPLSPSASRYVNAVVEAERVKQPHEDIGMWAGHGLTAGYCLRRIEEVEVLGDRLSEVETDVPTLEAKAEDIAAGIRTTGAEPYYLLAESVVIDELDEMIAGEIDRRLEPWQDGLPAATRAEMEQYIAWWVVRGYALRVAETRGEQEP